MLSMSVMFTTLPETKLKCSHFFSLYETKREELYETLSMYVKG